MSVNPKHPGNIQIPEILPIVSIRNTVFFPNQFIPLAIGRPKSLRLVEHALNEGTAIGVISQKDGSIDDPTTGDLFQIGTIAKILKVIDLPDGSKSAFIQGVSRFEVVNFTGSDPFFMARVKKLDDIIPEDELKINAMSTNLKNLFQKASDLAPEITNEHQAMIANLHDPGIICDLIVAFTNIQVEEKQSVLEILDLENRLNHTTYIFNRYLQALELGKKIQTEVQDEISKSQREMYLRQQLKAIQKELGEYEDVSDISEIRKRFEDAKLPEEVGKVAEKEIDRLSRMHPASAEYTVARTYLDWLLDIPWHVSTEDNLVINSVREKLEADHYGLDKVKTRILEYLAVRKLKNDMRGPILFVMRQRFAATEELISAPYRGGLFRASNALVPTTRFLCWMKLIKLEPIFAETLQRLYWRYWIRSKTLALAIITWKCLSIFPK
jgi:ATP-dependent Lon protease